MVIPLDLELVRDQNIKIPYSINSLSQYYYELQRILNSNCFVEIGAFEAEFSRQMKIMFPSSSIWAFEASPYCYEHYKELNSSINYLNFAVSDKDGEIKFSLQDKKISDGSEIEKVRGNNSILNRNDDSISYKEVSVGCIRFDSFVEEKSLTTSSISLWIDVEGANKNVFFGSKKYLKNVQSLLIEVEEYEYWKDQWLVKDVDSFLRSQNFIPIARDFEDNIQYNIVYINNQLLSDTDIDNKINIWILNYFKTLGLKVDYV